MPWYKNQIKECFSTSKRFKYYSLKYYCTIHVLFLIDEKCLCNHESGLPNEDKFVRYGLPSDAGGHLVDSLHEMCLS